MRPQVAPPRPRDQEPPVRSYDRTWEEIEQMLDQALAKQRGWRDWYQSSKDHGDKDSMKEAARNHKALDGVIKTLRWVLGEEGVDHPLS